MTGYKFWYADNGNCRVYYKRGRDVFCYQLDRPGEFKFFACSRDGEPSHEVHEGEHMPAPRGDERIVSELNNWASARYYT